MAATWELPGMARPEKTPAGPMAWPITTGKEVNTMFDQYDRTLARLAQADRVRELERRALVRRQLPAPTGAPLRRQLGLQLIRLGARLAADRPFEPARIP